MTVVNVIPTYNERENVIPMLEELSQITEKNPQWKFFTLVVDDNSPDGTGDLVQKWIRREKDKTVFLISGEKNGLGNALARGLDYAIKKLNADVIVTNDCDFSWDPKAIPKLARKIEEGYDVALASRYKGGKVVGWGLFRKLNHWISNVFFGSFVAGVNEVSDRNGNFRAIRVKGVLDKADLNGGRIKISGFVFPLYCLYKLSKVTQRFYELPVIFKYRIAGEAKIGMKHFKTYLRDVAEYIKISILIRIDRITRANLI